MKKYISIGAIVAVALSVWVTLFSGGSRLETYHAKNMPLSFEYPKGYVVSEEATRIVLVTAEDQASIERGERQGGEFPPAITITRYDNPNNPGPKEWAEQYPMLSNLNLKIGDVAETGVSDFPAIRYSTDGLYPATNVVFADASRLYHVVGQYLDRDSALYRDFPGIVSSITVE